MYIQNDNNSKVVTARILIFLGGCIVALMIIVHVCTIFINEDSCCEQKELVDGNKVWSNKVASLQHSWPDDQESLPILPAYNSCCSEALTIFKITLA